MEGADKAGLTAFFAIIYSAMTAIPNEFLFILNFQ